MLVYFLMLFGVPLILLALVALNGYLKTRQAKKDSFFDDWTVL